MQKGKLIEKYIGEAVKPLGFSYEGRKDDSWIFEKKAGKLVQTISLYEYRFDKNMISFDLYTNVRGKGIVQAVDIKGIEWDGSLPGFWKYEDEAEFIEVLGVIGALLKEKARKILGKLSVPDKIEDTNEMYQMLYAGHKELGEAYQNEHGIIVTGFDQENVDRWFAAIGKQAEELQKGKYEDAKEEIVKMAAFLGDTLIRFKGGRWEQYVADGFESCSIVDVKAKNDSGINILRTLVGGYAGNGMQWAKMIYSMLID